MVKEWAVGVSEFKHPFVAWKHLAPLPKEASLGSTPLSSETPHSSAEISAP